MNIPDYQGLMLPILQRLADQGGELAINALSEMVAAAVDMDDAERTERLPSGLETVFESRMRWALSYLEASRSISTSPAGVVRLSEIGVEQATEEMAPRQPHRPVHGPSWPPPAPEEPEALMQQYFQIYYERLKDQLIQRIHAQSPAFFEDLIIDLLVAMGYGRRRPDLARTLGRSGDGGIDGVMRQDSLGLDVVYVQAKRYRPGVAVGVAAVRDFAGALDAHKADKGVFVTTSHFPESAIKFAEASRRRIALIDGARLTSLLIRHSVAVRPHMTYELKHVDEGYFAGDREDAMARRA